MSEEMEFTSQDWIETPYGVDVRVEHGIGLVRPTEKKEPPTEEEVKAWIDESSNIDKAVLWLAGTLDSLIEQGILTGPKQITGRGVFFYVALKDSGFEPDTETLAMLTSYFQRGSL